MTVNNNYALFCKKLCITFITKLLGAWRKHDFWNHKHIDFIAAL